MQTWPGLNFPSQRKHKPFALRSFSSAMDNLLYGLWLELLGVEDEAEMEGCEDWVDKLGLVIVVDGTWVVRLLK